MRPHRPGSMKSIFFRPVSKQWQNLIAGLGIPADAALFDGRDVPLDCRHIGKAIIKGDATVSIDCGSVHCCKGDARQNYGPQMDSIYPQYGFEGHKGYGSAKPYGCHRDLWTLTASPYGAFRP